MRVQHRIQNFNPQQSKLHVRNITENESIFVMVPYDQDRVVSADKPAKVAPFFLYRGFNLIVSLASKACGIRNWWHLGMVLLTYRNWN